MKDGESECNSEDQESCGRKDGAGKWRSHKHFIVQLDTLIEGSEAQEKS